MSENPVLLGVVDQNIGSGDIHVLDNTCFGKVSWLDPSPPQSSTTCPLCNKIMSFVAQITCPFPGKSADLNRKIVICVCPEHSKRSEGWRVIRQIVHVKKVQVVQDSNDWGENDEWGEDEDEVDWMANKVQVRFKLTTFFY